LSPFCPYLWKTTFQQLSEWCSFFFLFLTYLYFYKFFCLLFIYLVIYLLEIVVLTQDPYLQGTHTTTWFMAPTFFFFWFSYFLGTVLHFCLGLASYPDPPIVTSDRSETSVACHHTQFIGWDEVLPTCYPGWPQTAMFPISASWVAGITDVSHPTQLYFLITFSIMK
jgi:hypothetical protein